MALFPAAQLNHPAGSFSQVDGFTGSGQGLGVNQYGQELSNSEGRKATYSASITAFTPQATPQDFFVLTGSTAVVTRLLEIEVWIAATAACAMELSLNFNSAVNTGGTSTAPAAVPHDPSDVAASCAVAAYTAAPTAGTKVGSIRSGRVVGGTITGGGSGIASLKWTFTANNDKAPILRTAAQQFALNGLGAALPSGAVFEVRFTWSEESLTGN